MTVRTPVCDLLGIEYPIVGFTPSEHVAAELLGPRPRAGYRRIPYIFVAPPERDTIGKIARDVFKRYYGGLLHAHRSPQLAFLGRVLDGVRQRWRLRARSPLPAGR